MIHSSWDIEFDRLKLVIMSHFMPFYPSPLKPKKSESWKKKLQEISSFYMCTKNQSYEVRFLRYRVSQTEFLSFWAIFALLLPLPHPNNPKNPNFEKTKKMPGDIITLHMYTINENHVMYGSWDKECDRQNLFSLQKICFHLKENP